MIDSDNPLPLEEWIAADSRIAQGRPVISRTRVHVDGAHGINQGMNGSARWHHYYQLAVPGGPPIRERALRMRECALAGRCVPGAAWQLAAEIRGDWGNEGAGGPSPGDRRRSFEVVDKCLPGLMLEVQRR